MNKIFGIACLTLIGAFQGLQGNNLELIRQAIEASNVAQVKANWRKLDILVESAKEKESILESLIERASQIATESKESAQVSTSPINYKKVFAGTSLIFAGVALLLTYSVYQGHPFDLIVSGDTSSRVKMEALGAFSTYLACAYIGRNLVRVGLGWEGVEPIIAGARSKSALILSYLQEQLQDLRQENLTS